MLKHYTFNVINESKQDFNSPDMQKAINAAKKKSLGEPDTIKFLKSADGKWNVAVLIYGDELDGEKYVYSYNSDKILNDEPVNRISRFTNQGDYLIVGRFTNDKKLYTQMEYNFLDERGFTLKRWPHQIYGAPDSDGYHIMCDEEGYNLIDVNGNKGFEDPKNDIVQYGDYLYVEDDVESILFDKNGKIVLEGITSISDNTYSYYDENDEYTSHKFYVIEFEDNMRSLYSEDMELMVDDFEEIVNTDDDFYYVKTSYDEYNIIGPDCKMVFGNDPYSKDGWANNIEEHPEDNKANIHLVEKGDKCNLFDGKHLKLLFDEWADEIKFMDMKYLHIDLVAAVLKNDKCNLLVLDPDNPKFMQFLFNDWIDDISRYEDFFIVKKGKDNYLLWNNTRLIMVEFDHIYRTEDEETYVIENDGKFDLINTRHDETFCEIYMNGNKFDACLDITSFFPLVEYKGKYLYISAELFKPKFLLHGKLRWFDDAEPYDGNDSDPTFKVVENGVEKILNEFGDEIDDDYFEK